MSEYKLSDTIEISISKAKSLIEQFFSIVPSVKKFLDSLGKFGRRNFYIATPPPYYRRRYFKKTYDNKDLGSIERASKNMPIQGCNADITKLALVYCYEYIVEQDWWNPSTKVNKCCLIHTVHDEIQSECDSSMAEEWKNKMQELMEYAGKAVLKTIPMNVDCTISDCWTK